MDCGMLKFSSVKIPNRLFMDEFRETDVFERGVNLPVQTPSVLRKDERSSISVLVSLLIRDSGLTVFNKHYSETFDAKNVFEFKIMKTCLYDMANPLYVNANKSNFKNNTKEFVLESIEHLSNKHIIQTVPSLDKIKLYKPTDNFVVILNPAFDPTHPEYEKLVPKERSAYTIISDGVLRTWMKKTFINGWTVLAVGIYINYLFWIRNSRSENEQDLVISMLNAFFTHRLNISDNTFKAALKDLIDNQVIDTSFKRGLEKDTSNGFKTKRRIIRKGQNY